MGPPRRIDSITYRTMSGHSVLWSYVSHLVLPASAKCLAVYSTIWNLCHRVCCNTKQNASSVWMDVFIKFVSLCLCHVFVIQFLEQPKTGLKQTRLKKEHYLIRQKLQFQRDREKFYLTTHSTHFIYSYMASDIWLRTILIVRKETLCRHIGYTYRLTARVLLYAPSHRQDNTYHGLCYTSRGALAGTRNSSMGLQFHLR